MNELDLKTEERRQRSRWFYRWLTVFLLMLVIFLIYELRTILLPILMGAILAYLFRPIKKWVQVSWLPHEAGVILAFAVAALMVSGVVLRVKEMIPDERQKLELKVRLKYKMNERYQLLFQKPGPIGEAMQHEIQPFMMQLNEWLNLSDSEVDLFKKYRVGYHGQPPISDRYYDYFKKNIKETSPDPILLSAADENPKESGSWLETLSIWILTPLIFIFMIFDNGQIRVSLISMVPNRYFELALTMVDELDEAIGKYLRGTFLECSLVGMTMGFGLLAVGFPFSVALFVAVVSGMANAIPFLGPAIGLVISLAYALIAEDVSPLIPWLSPESLPLYVAVLVGITHLLDNILYSPVVLGGAVNLHPMVVIVAITGGSILLGFWGMLLAIPTVVVFKTGLETLLKELKAYRII